MHPKELEMMMFEGRPYYLGRESESVVRLLSASGDSSECISQIPVAEVLRASRRMAGNAGILDSALLTSYDAYYYDLHDRLRPLPVYRVDLADPKSLPSPLYIDALRGELVGRVNNQYRVFRWYGSALHTMDFPLLFFHQTVWHVVLVGLALLGALLSGSGLWLGFLHLGRLTRGSSTRATPMQP